MFAHCQAGSARSWASDANVVDRTNVGMIEGWRSSCFAADPREEMANQQKRWSGEGRAAEPGGEKPRTSSSDLCLTAATFRAEEVPSRDAFAKANDSRQTFYFRNTFLWFINNVSHTNHCTRFFLSAGPDYECRRQNPFFSRSNNRPACYSCDHCSRE
jgi:hypothetical protein